MKKIKTFLKVAILIALGILVLGFTKISNNSSEASSTTASSTTKWLTYDTSNNVWTTTTSESKYGALSLAESLYYDPTRLTSLSQTALSSLLNAEFDFYGDRTGLSYFEGDNNDPSDRWNIDYPTAVCFDTTADQDDTSTAYMIWQIISMELNSDGEFVTYNYVHGKLNQTIVGTDSSTYLAKLGYAVYRATQTSYRKQNVWKLQVCISLLNFCGGKNRREWENKTEFG